LMGITCLTSCKKKSNSTGNLVMMENDAGLVSSYTYDGQGRVTNVQYSDNTRETYSYSAGTVTYQYYDSGVSTPGETTIYTLNSQGLATSDVSTGPDVTGGTELDSFTYNSQGYTTYANYGGQMWTYLYTNDDLTLEIPATTTIDTLINTYLSVTDNRNWGEPFLGLDSKNLLSTEHDQLNYYNHTHTYQYDSQGRVTQETVNPAYSGSGVEVITYSY